MVGIDVSQRMAQITAATGYYDCVHHADVCAALRQLDCTSIAPIDGTQSAEDSALLERGAAQDSAKDSRIGMDMVVAADTFIYVGALGEVFDLVSKVLRRPSNAPILEGQGKTDLDGRIVSEGGLFMFTTEDLELSPMRVTTTASSTTASTTTSTEGTTQATECSPVSSSNGGSNGHDVEIAGAVPGWGAQLLSSARFAHSDAYIRALSALHGYDVLVHKRVVLRTEETIPLPGNIYILQKRWNV
jgi:predicted TPR repeat methyltransferase